MFKLLCTLVLALGQQPAAAAATVPAAEEDASRRFPPSAVPDDYVVAVIGDEIITMSDLDRFVKMEINAGRIRNQQERMQAHRMVQRERAMHLLKSQAGRDLGIDPELLKLSVNQRLESIVETQGGAQAATEFFQQLGMTTQDVIDYFTIERYKRSWEESVTGKGFSRGGRPSVDRYVRPGWKMARYKLIAGSTNAEQQALIGAAPVQFVLQHLVLPIDPNRPEADTLDLGRELFEQASRGADFDQMIQNYGAVTPGLTRKLTRRQVSDLSRARHRGGALFDFVAAADPGDYCEPMVGWNGERSFVWVYKLVERSEAREPQPFLDPKVQAALEDDLEESLDSLKLRLALDELIKGSYLWPPALKSAPEAPETPVK